MNVAVKNEVPWKSRDPWLCVLALILGDFVIHTWLRIGVRNSLAFSELLRTSLGSALIVALQAPLFLFLALWFTRVSSIRDFVKHVGLRRGVSFPGWCTAWLAVGIGFIDVYGASKGWTASSMHSPPVGYDTLGGGWWFLALKTILIVPFYEEVVTRGFLYKAFRGSYEVSLTMAIIFLFSAYFHLGSVSRSMFTFVCLASLWTLLCLVREWTGSLWNCVLCHAAYNAAIMHFWLAIVIVLPLFLPYFTYRAISLWRVTVLKSKDENGEPDAAPSNRPPSQLPISPKGQTPDSLRTPSSGGCG